MKIQMTTTRLYFSPLTLALLAAVTLTGCSSMQEYFKGGVSVGMFHPLKSGFSNSTMYSFDLHMKLNDKWRAGAELQSVNDFTGRDYLFEKTSVPSLGGSTPVYSSIAMTNTLFSVQYFPRRNIIIDAGYGESKSEAKDTEWPASYNTPLGNSLPSGNVFSLKTLLTTKTSIGGVYPYVGVSFMRFNLDGVMQASDGTQQRFGSLNAMSLLVGAIF